MASKINIKPGAISQILARLEQQQYIARSINPKSCREIFVTLGEKGTDLYQAYGKIDQRLILLEV